MLVPSWFFLRPFFGTFFTEPPYEAFFAESIALQTQNEYLSRMRSAATKDLKSVREELSAVVGQLASARSELAVALPMLKSAGNELSSAKSDLALTRSNLADAVAESSSLKTSLEQMSHSYEQEKLEKQVAERGSSRRSKVWRLSEKSKL